MKNEFSSNYLPKNPAVKLLIRLALILLFVSIGIPMTIWLSREISYTPEESEYSRRPQRIYHFLVPYEEPLTLPRSPDTHTATRYPGYSEDRTGKPGTP